MRTGIGVSNASIPETSLRVLSWEAATTWTEEIKQSLLKVDAKVDGGLA